MTLPPETDALIAELVRSGRFPSAELALSVAVAELAYGASADLVWDQTLDDEDLAAIAEADAEAERGEGLTFEQVRDWLLGPPGQQP
jgi:Arc/MetJ-type ribon-helix-helix transcriptional regulator